MKTRSLVVLAVLIALAATVGIMLPQPSENVAAKAATKGEVQLEFTVKIPVPLGDIPSSVDIPLGDIPSSIDIPVGDIPSSVDIPTVLDAVRTGVTNIGSSGEDGVRFDAFFDVFFEVETSFELNPPCKGCTATARTDLIGTGLAMGTDHPIQIFFIGIGVDADLNVGRVLAEATGAEFQGVTEEDLANVLAEFSGYF